MNWREDLLDTKVRLGKYKVELLKNGAKNYSQALVLKSYYEEWKTTEGCL